MVERAASRPPRVIAPHTISRFLGAAAILAVGVDHIEQYWVDDYRVIPTIGPLFLLLFIGSLVVAGLLVAPLRALPPGLGRAARLAAASGGLAMSLGSLVGLFVSESTPLFGFMEHGYRTAIVLAIVTEASAALLLAGFVAPTLRERPRRRSATSRQVERASAQGGRA
jgi:hypothetical protein